jgi:CBS domain containing-hemolysin-like protein
VLHLFGKMPERGEVISFEVYQFRIESVSRTRILKIRIEKESNDRTEVVP